MTEEEGEGEMGRKTKWFLTVKRALTPQCNKKSLKSQKSKNKSKFGNSKKFDLGEVSKTSGSDSSQPLPPRPPPTDEIKVIRREDEQKRHAYSVALASAVAAEAAAVAAQAAAEVVRLTTSTVASRVPGRSREDIAAMKIQTALRGYLARRSLWGLKGLVRLKTMVDGASVKRQTINTLHSSQTMSRVQSQIRARRVRMTEENLAFQRQLQLKHDREPLKSNIGEKWDDSLQTKEQIEARLLYKHEAAMRRERTLAYAFSHQWKSSSRAMAPAFTDLNDPQWSWSWLERWMAARPWENRDVGEGDNASMKNGIHNFAAKAAKADRDSSIPPVHRTWPSSRQPRTTPPSKPPSSAGKTKPTSSGGSRASLEDDSRSMVSSQSELPRRHSITGSSVRDDESLASSSAVPGYMASTESARFRSRFCSLEPPETRSICSVKLRLSLPALDKQSALSPAKVRRHSGPPRVDIAALKDAASQGDQITHTG